MMAEETWMTAQEALDFGFIDSISEQMDMAACAKFGPIMAKANFKNIPECLAAKKLTMRDLEEALRDKGCTEAMAKAILANGYRNEQREVALPAEQREVAAPEVTEEEVVASIEVPEETEATEVVEETPEPEVPIEEVPPVLDKTQRLIQMAQEIMKNRTV